MSESTEKLLLFLGGAVMGSLAVVALTKESTALRPGLAGLAAGALDLRDKAIGAVQCAKEDISDFMAEVEYARAVNAEQEACKTEEQVEPTIRKANKAKKKTVEA
jgi:hypothetical protein